MGIMGHTCSHSTWRAGLQNKPLCVSPLHAPIQSSVRFLVYFVYIASTGFINHTSALPQYFCSGVLDENQNFMFPPVTSPVFFLSFLNSLYNISCFFFSASIFCFLRAVATLLYSCRLIS